MLEEILPERIDSGLVNQLGTAFHAIMDAYAEKNDHKNVKLLWTRIGTIGLMKTEKLYH